MNSIMRHILRALLMFGMLVCLGFSLAGYTRLDSMRNVVNYSLSGNPMTLSDVEKLRQKEQNLDIGLSTFTAWTEKEKETFVNEKLNRTVQETVILLNGDSANLYFNETNLTALDTGSCLLSEAASFDIFGDKNAVGETIQYGERKVEVAGILQNAEKLVVMQAIKPQATISVSDAQNSDSSGEETNTASTKETDGDTASKDEKKNREQSFDQIAVYSMADSRETQKMKIKSFAERNSLGSDSSDMGSYQEMSAIFSALVPVIMALIMIFCGIYSCIENRRKPVLFLIDLAGTIAFCIALYWISGTRFQLTANMTPSQWSDFDYWGKQIENGIEILKKMLFASKGLPEIDYYNAMLVTALCSIGALLCFGASVWGLKIENAGQLYLNIILSLLACMGAVLILQSKSVILFRTALLFFSYPLYFIGHFLLIDISRQELEN